MEVREIHTDVTKMERRAGLLKSPRRYLCVSDDEARTGS
jgi:hypothetical protein